MPGTVSDETRTVYGRPAPQFAAWVADQYPDVRDGTQLTRRHVDE